MKILLATDGSEYSAAAAKFLTRLNFTAGDGISVIYAVSWAPVMNEWESIYIDYKAIRNEIAPKVLEPAVHILQAVKAKVTSSVIEDFPDKAIIDEAVRSGADLIVMGARGLRGIGSYIVGSVTKLVAINSPMPVLVINPPMKELSGKMKILFATDGSAHSKSVCRALSSLPFPADTEVTVLNVVFPVLSEIPERFVLEINDRVKKLAADTRDAESKTSEKIIKEAQGYLEKRFTGIEGITRFGDPSVEILKAADELNSDIIAVGSAGMRGIKGIIGSVSRYVLNHSRCSVLIGKA